MLQNDVFHQYIQFPQLIDFFLLQYNLESENLKDLLTCPKRSLTLKEEADYILDTSHLLVRELKAEIDHIFVENGSYHNFFITEI